MALKNALSKQQKTTRIGKEVEKLGPSHITGGTQDGVAAEEDDCPGLL